MLRSQVLLLCAVALTTLSIGSCKEDAADLLLKGFGRRLTEEESAVELKDRTFAFLTKYEENFNYSVITTTAKAYALWGWYEKGKSIKYAIVASTNAADALTATTGADITFVHLHVDGTRGQNSTEKYPLAKAGGAFEVKEGFKVYAEGTITDANVTSWNSTKYKTAADIWSQIEEGNTYTNIHTKTYPDGEARGQNDWSYEDIEVVEDLLDENLRKNDDNWRLAFMTTFEQTKPVTGNSTARAIAVYGWDGSKIQYGVVSVSKPTDGLSGVMGYKDIAGIHIHVGAPRGQDASTLIPLTLPTDATWKTEKGLRIYAQGVIADADITKYTANSNNSKVPITSVKGLWDLILTGNTYTNIHTPNNPAGEVRGQNDWSYAGLDATKTNIPADAASAKGSGNFAPALKPCLSFILGAAVMLLLA